MYFLVAASSVNAKHKQISQWIILYHLLQIRQSDDGQFYVVEGDIDGTKQMLSVAEDGSVQMVQVMWDDIDTADDNMQFWTFRNYLVNEI